MSWNTETKEYLGILVCPSCHFTAQYKSGTQCLERSYQQLQGTCHYGRGAITVVRECNAMSTAASSKTKQKKKKQVDEI